MGKTTALPKNIRQIGEIEGDERICLEDYVMTCIRKKEMLEKDGYFGIFLGEQEQADDGTYVFIRGLLELPKEEDAAQMKAQLEEQRQKYFPEWEVQGCCVIGQYPTERMKLTEEQIPDSVKLIYHLQEQEENLYQVSDGRYRRVKGYFVFYEQNRRMQEYLAEEFQDDRVEKESFSDRAIRTFRQKIQEKSEKKSGSMLRLAGSLFAVTVLVIGAIAVTRLEGLRRFAGRSELEYTAENEAGEGRIYLSTSAPEDIEEEPQTLISGGDATQSGGTAAYTGAETRTAMPVTGGTVSTGQASGTEAAVSNEAVSTGQTDGAKTAVTDEAVSTGQADGAEAAISDEAVSTGQAGGAEAAVSDEAVSTGQADSAEAAVTDEAVSTGQAGINTAELEIPAAPYDPYADMLEGVPSDAEGAQGQNAQDEDGTRTPRQAAARRTYASYTIREGDTLADICTKYYGNIGRLEELCELNHITDANMIMPGEKILLP